jgi:L-asparaginase
MGAEVQETVARTNANIVNGDNVAGKGRILLQLTLTKTTDWHEVKRYFDEY